MSAVPALGYRVVRLGAFSGRVPVRTALVCLIGWLAAAAIGLLSLTRGEFEVPVADVAQTLLGHGSARFDFIVLELRLPRVGVGLLVGACLGMAGALTQTFARNALASPDVLGVTDGAATGAVAVIVLSGTSGALSTSLSGLQLSTAALAGGLAASALVYLLAWRHGMSGRRLILVGIGCGAVLSALTSWLLVTARIWDASAAALWLSGSLNAVSWERAQAAVGALLLLGPVALILSASLRASQLGDDSARGLGVRLQLTQLVTLVVAVTLTAAAVAAAGPIEFVAFVVPQVALRLCRTSRPPMLTSAALGAVLVLVSDLLARLLLPNEVPVGLVTAVLGSPYLIWLLLRTNRKAVA